MGSHMGRMQVRIFGTRLVFFCAAVLAAGSSLTSESLSAADDRPTSPAVVPGPPAGSPLARGQADAYRANRHKSVVELQQFRHITRTEVTGRDGQRTVASLIDLNPAIGAWYLLRVETATGTSTADHLETVAGSRLRLDPTYRTGLVVMHDGGLGFRCELFAAGGNEVLAMARASGLAYAPLCGGRVYLRNAMAGRRSAKELVVDLLRDHVWQGEEITALVRDVFYQDAYLQTPSVLPAASARTREVSGPLPLRVSAVALERQLEPVGLGLGLAAASVDRLGVGLWYPLAGDGGVFVSALRPDLVAPDVIAAQGRRVAVLDLVESKALVYLVAFDLDKFDLGFRLGTDHPRVGWSDMVVNAVRDKALTGPDGIETIDPLVRTGMLSPVEAEHVVATFTGGFKRTHGAFRFSPLAQRQHGSHYGFVENGVVLSKLNPGLATVVVFNDGRVDLRTWTPADDALLPRIRHARQNGVAIVEPEAGSGRIGPGARVREWGAGNWSGSADRSLRTLRAGLCLQEAEGERYLVYGYFSSATPSAMARVFQAANCRYAMLLDMNALEHTYLAVYQRQGGKLSAEHLIEGMAVVDSVRNGRPAPRFVAVADNRDFFYLLRRGRP